MWLLSLAAAKAAVRSLGIQLRKAVVTALVAALASKVLLEVQVPLEATFGFDDDVFRIFLL